MTTQLTIPWDLKYKFAMGGWTSNLKGFMYAIREKYGATAALEIHERLCKRADRVKNMTNAILNVFQLEGNNAETIGKWWDLYCEICGIEGTILERSKTIVRTKITKCPFKTDPKDLSEWNLPFYNIIAKTINSKAIFERPKAMCAGDAYCEYVYKLEESIPSKGEEEIITKKVSIPWELKYKFAMGGWTSNLKGFFYAIREKYGAAAALEMYERLCSMDNRYKNMTKTLLKVFKIEGNDAETIRKYFEIWWELTGGEGTAIERSKTFVRRRLTKCQFKLEAKDLSNWCTIAGNIVIKTINPKTTMERLKGMCAGDPYCESVYKIEE